MLRHLADLADSGECGVDTDTLAKVAELHLLDHQRIDILSDAVKNLMGRKKCLKIKMHSHAKKK